MFTKHSPGTGQIGRMLMCSVWWLLWYKYSHHTQFQCIDILPTSLKHTWEFNCRLLHLLCLHSRNLSLKIGGNQWFTAMLKSSWVHVDNYFIRVVLPGSCLYSPGYWLCLPCHCSLFIRNAPCLHLISNLSLLPAHRKLKIQKCLFILNCLCPFNAVYKPSLKIVWVSCVSIYNLLHKPKSILTHSPKIWTQKLFEIGLFLPWAGSQNAMEQCH